MIRPALFAAPLAALLLTLLPASLMAQPHCLALGGQMALCPGDSPWANARPIPVTDEDGVIAYEVPPLYLEASLNWVARAEAETMNAALALIERQLAEEAAADGDTAPERRLRDTLATEHATVALDIYTEFFDGKGYPLAVLLVADGNDWLTLFLSGDEPIPENRFADEVRSLAHLLRPAAEG